MSRPRDAPFSPHVRAAVGGRLHTKHVLARPEIGIAGIALPAVHLCPLLLQASSLNR